MESQSESWQLQRAGEVSGPHDDEAILAMIAAGMHNALIRRGEHDSWQPLASHPPFADALRWAPPRDHAVKMQAPDRFGWALLATPCLGAVAVFLLDTDRAKLASYATVMVCAALIAYDARRWKIYPAARWVVGTLVLWMVAYPLYLHHRAKRGASKLLAPGLAIVALFMASSLSGLLAELMVECTVLASGDAECTLTNQGFAPGSGCFRVKLIRIEDGIAAVSPRFCEDVWPGAEERKTYPQAIPDPVGHCGGGDWAETCTVDIEFIEQ